MSLSLFKCDFCKHYHNDVKNKSCCDAFPDEIPLEKMNFFDEDDKKDEEYNNGIKFEEE